jgi:small subunit ribosomal protein S7
VTPDVKYQSELVARLINTVMRRGKKSVAERVVYGALDVLREKVPDKSPLETLTQAVENVKPKLEVKSRRVGGATYQVPVEVPEHRQTSLALRWIRMFADARKGVPMTRALAMEILDAYNNTGSAIKKREDTHKMAQANKAFAHYRW